VLGDLAEFTHFVTRLKIVPALADDVSLTEAERTRGRGFAQKLSMRVLARAWQMLLKGIAEVEAAGRPLAAAEMVLVRIAYAADLPTPDEVVRALSDSSSAQQRGNGGGASAPSTRSETPLRSQAAPRSEPLAESRGSGPRAALSAPVTAAIEAPPETGAAALRTLARFEDLIALATERRDLTMKSALERDVRLVRFEDGTLEIALEPSAPKTLVGDLSKKLNEWTGRRWMVAVSAEAGAPTMKAQAEARKAELKDTVRADPLVQAVLSRFPGAEIVDVRPPAGAAAADGEEPPLPSDSDAAPADEE
jgi:DNA polymerase-3 subunit gamma/tau